MTAWTQFLYQYGVGGAMFLATLLWAFRTGAVRWENRTDRRLVWALIAALLGFVTVHAVWIAWANSAN